MTGQKVRYKKSCRFIEQFREAGRRNSRFLENDSIKFISLTLPSFLNLLDYKNKLREYWLPRITDKLIMIGSQFIHMFTTSLGQRTIDKHTTTQNA